MTNTEKIQEITRLLREIKPNKCSSISATVYDYCKPDCTMFGAESVDEGHDILRSFGVGDREKRIIDHESPSTVVEGRNPSDIKIVVFCAGLPHTCHIEERTERIPKTKTVEVGEFIEIKVRKVVCGEPKAEPQPA